MNQKKLWISVALSTAVLGMPSTVGAQTTGGKATPSPSLANGNVIKVGEYQSPAARLSPNNVITKVHSHNLEGRQAATLFVRDIPVITFIGSESTVRAETKLGIRGKFNYKNIHASTSNKSVKAAGSGNVKDISNRKSSTHHNPVDRAGILAAKLNQLTEGRVDASKISVSWKGITNSKSISPKDVLPEAYVIKINDTQLVEINDNTRLPDTTNNLAEDALQVTNRLRRLIGKASPLKEVANLPATDNLTPDSPEQVLYAHHTRRYRARRRRRGGFRGRVRGIFRGLASFYGYDGSSNKTASGERFHPEKMTAAHRSLPFGTRVRVTNPRNGRSVVVRINDRGPFIRGRVIDLSYGAARVLGIIRRGVAPVKIQILGR